MDQQIHFGWIFLLTLVVAVPLAAQPDAVVVDTASLVRAIMYPSAAARKNIGGLITAQISIDSTGTIIGLELYETPVHCGDAGEQADGFLDGSADHNQSEVIGGTTPEESRYQSGSDRTPSGMSLR